jgi:hypothetical protein
MVTCKSEFTINLFISSYTCVRLVSSVTGIFFKAMGLLFTYLYFVLLASILLQTIELNTELNDPNKVTKLNNSIYKHICIYQLHQVNLKVNR